MRRLMISVHPEWVEKILNGDKTIELRKMFPKNYSGWVYIYVTKGQSKLNAFTSSGRHGYVLDDYGMGNYGLLNGKVVARFWCDKVEKYTWFGEFYKWGYQVNRHFIENSCLTVNEINEYGKGKDLFAIHISQLEIFDKPKELGEFYHYKKKLIDCGMDCPPYIDEVKVPLTKAPQKMVWVEE